MVRPCTLPSNREGHIAPREFRYADQKLISGTGEEIATPFGDVDPIVRSIMNRIEKDLGSILMSQIRQFGNWRSRANAIGGRVKATRRVLEFS